MNIWLITIGEPLPSDPGANRMLRTGILAGQLAEKGHTAIWWTSTFDHVHKQQRAKRDVDIDVNENLKLRLLHSCSYRNNVSLTRIANHWDIGHKFKRLSKKEPGPDVILCSLPTIELSMAAATFGAGHDVPVIIDVRDLWPDAFYQQLPPALAKPASFALRHYKRQTTRIFHTCSGIVGISQAYLDWALDRAGRVQSERDAVFPIGYRPLRQNETSPAPVPDAWNLKPDKINCWFVGIFGRTYDLASVVAAAKELKRRGENGFQFIFSGQGEKLKEWESSAAGLENVIFTGWLDASQIQALAAMADVGLMAYASKAPQGLPNKLFEYMAAGLPVLSSLAGETAQLLEHNECGFTYVPDRPEDFIAKLLLLKDAKRRRQLGENAARAFQNNFSADDVYANMITYLERIAASH